MASLTGRFQTQGAQALTGLETWVSDVNNAGGILVGRHGDRIPVSLVHHDDGSDPERVADLTERLILRDGVDLLFGPYSSMLTLAAAPVAEALGRVLWNHGGASDAIYKKGYKWTVGILSPASRYFQGAVDLVRQMDPGASRVVIISSRKGSFAPAVAGGAEARARQLAFADVIRLEYDPGTADFSPLLDRLAEKRPDLVLGVGLPSDDIRLAGQIAAAELPATAVALVAAGIAGFRDALGDRSEGFIGPSQWEPAADYLPDFGPGPLTVADRLRPTSTPGACPPDYPSAQAYAAGLVAQKCIQETGSLDNQSLRDAAAHLDFTTFYGKFRIDPRTGEQLGHRVTLVQWRRGRKVAVWPPEIREARALYPFSHREAPQSEFRPGEYGSGAIEHEVREVSGKR